MPSPVTADLRIAWFETAIAADKAAALDSSVLVTSMDSDTPDDTTDYSTHATSIASSNDSMPTLMSAITTVAATLDIPAAAASTVQMLNFTIHIDFQHRSIHANVLEWALNYSLTYTVTCTILYVSCLLLNLDTGIVEGCLDRSWATILTSQHVTYV
ncbi:hypothetical protein C8R44DRAFT_751906 [Mycena epipterygia]|nr:hypothetical protein C8R44DRAFT_751906 [Mycena epipterygia]